MGHLTGHVVICNWNGQSQRIVESIHPEIFDESEQDWFPVVIVASDVTGFPDNDRFEDTLLVPGSPLNYSLLKRANVHDAHTVIIVADRTLSNPDDQTLQIALTIQSILEAERDERERKAREEGTEVEPLIGPRIVAEVLDAARAPNFQRHEITGIHEVVCETDLCVRVLAQTNLSPGLTYLLADILEYDANENDIYTVSIPDHSDFVGREFNSFSELVMEVARRSFHPENRRSALLLGLRRTDDKNEDTMVVNPDTDRLKKAFKCLLPGDALVLLAQDPKHARMALTERHPVPLKQRSATA